MFSFSVCERFRSSVLIKTTQGFLFVKVSFVNYMQTMFQAPNCVRWLARGKCVVAFTKYSDAGKIQKRNVAYSKFKVSLTSVFSRFDFLLDFSGNK